MDLGLKGRKALVCASSAGLGLACASALAAEGVHVVINGRSSDRLAGVAAGLRADGRSVGAVCGDVTTDAGRAALLAACPDADILVNNNAGPPPRPFLDTEPQDWLVAAEANMVAPLALIRALVPGMVARRFGRIVNITSAMVTTPRPLLGLSSAARAGLTAVVKGLSLELAASNVTINNLLPERIDTGRQRQMAELVMAREGISWDEARARQVKSIAAGRLGQPEELGAACAFLCSALAGYISGQNLHLDGGSYPGLV